MAETVQSEFMAAREEDCACGVCKAQVENDDKGVLCDWCKSWFHSSCAEVAPSLYAVMTKYNTTKQTAGQLYWYCGSCNVDVKRLIKDVEGLLKKVDKIESEGKKTRTQIAEVKETAENVNRAVVGIRKDIDCLQKVEVISMKKEMAEIRGQSAEVKKSFADIVAGEESRASALRELQKAGCEVQVEEAPRMGAGIGGSNRRLQMEMAEAIDRDKRRHNLLIMGIKEIAESGEDDTEKVREIVEAVVVNGAKVEFQVLGRIGKSGGNRPRPVRIKVEEMGAKRLILMKAKGLKEVRGKESVYIVPDLTKVQQEEDWKLRSEIRRRREAGEIRVRVVKGEVVGESRVSSKVELNECPEVEGKVTGGARGGVEVDAEVTVKNVKNKNREARDNEAKDKEDKGGERARVKEGGKRGEKGQEQE